MNAGYTQPASIMNRVNLSWSTLMTILETLISTGYVAVNYLGTRRQYLITSLGKKALNDYIEAVKGFTDNITFAAMKRTF